MDRNWQSLARAILCLLILLLAMSCNWSLTFSTTPNTPGVVTQEVTRIVVATPTTYSLIAPESTEAATTPPVLITPESPSPTVEPTEMPLIEDELDTPPLGLQVLSEVAEVLLSQGIHTLRLTIHLSAPVDIVIRNGQQADESLTRLVADQLAEYEVEGDLIVDISVDDLAQQRWVIKALGGVEGINTEEIVEVWQNGDTVWERPANGEWTQRTLSEDEAMSPLANSFVVIDNYTHGINLSDLVVDALRPVLATRNADGSTWEEHGWTTLGAASEGFIEIRRERALSTSNNVRAIIAALTNSGISAYVNPADITHGIQDYSSVEMARLTPENHLPSEGQSDERGTGAVEFSYMGQVRTMLGVVTLRSENVYEYLPIITRVSSPVQ